MKKTFEGKNLTAYTCDTSEELISAITGLSLEEIVQRRNEIKQRIKDKI